MDWHKKPLLVAPEVGKADVAPKHFMGTMDDLLHKLVYIRHPGRCLRDHKEMGCDLHLLLQPFSRPLCLCYVFKDVY